MNSNSPGDLNGVADSLEDAFIEQPWQGLRRFTDARIALGRAGQSLPTHAHLNFQLAQAQARDAVRVAFDVARMVELLHADGHDALALHSAAHDRQTYLQRPDLGRRLSESSCASLRSWYEQQPTRPNIDVCFVLADGLSAMAVQSQAIGFLSLMRAVLASDQRLWKLGPVCIVEQGRVAVGDEVGGLLGADLVVVLIGERPGLSSPESMGIYMTWAPRVGRMDSERNCISNVRSAGLSLEDATSKLRLLMEKARTLQLTGVQLKDEEDTHSRLA